MAADKNRPKLTNILAAMSLWFLLGHVVVDERSFVVRRLAGASLVGRGPEVVAAVCDAELVAVDAEDDCGSLKEINYAT